ncbi:MAG: DMT family transporter, partial [Acidimicrobiales bacterium]
MTAAGIALLAALSFAVAAVLQQEAAEHVPGDKALTAGLVIDLLHRPKWLVGIGMAIAGFGLQALALANGPLALVQPVIAVELAMAIPLAIWRRRRRAGRREWIGIFLVLGGVAAFLLSASPEPGRSTPSLGAWIAVLVVLGSLIVGAGVLGARARERRRAMLLGVAAGVAFALLAVLSKSV